MGNFDRNRGGGRGGGGFDRGFNRGGRPTMHKAVCDACKSNCEVPFKPTGDKPIFCSDCFSKQGGGRSHDRHGGDRNRGPRSDNRGGSQDSQEILKGIKTLNYKLDELIKALGSNTPSEKASETKTTTKKKTPKKKVVAKKPTKKKTG